MKRFLVLATFFAAALAHADAPTQQSVDALFDLMHEQALVQLVTDRIEDGLRESAAKAAADAAMTPAQRATIDAFVTGYAATVRAEIGWDKMRPLYEQVFMQTFSQDEIDALAAFYASPAGQSFALKRPELMVRALQATQQQITTFLPKMRADLRQAIEDAKSAK